MELLKEPIKATTQINRILLYGPPKVGKTTFVSLLDSCAIIDLEKGSLNVTAIKYEINSLKELAELGKAIKDANYPYKYIAVDTTTALQDLCEDDATEAYMNSVIGKGFNRDEITGATLPKSRWESVLTLPKGLGYYWLRMSFEKWLNRLQTLAPTLILLAHVKDIYLTKGGKEVSAKDIDLMGKIRQITAVNTSVIGYMYREGTTGEKLMISFQSTDTVVCGSRLEHLRGKIIEANWNEIFI